MRVATLFFLAGILTCQTLSSLPNSAWALSLIPLAILAWKFYFLRWILFFAVGFFWTAWRAQFIIAQELPITLENKEVIVIGTIDDLPVQREKDWRFNLTPQKLQLAGQEFPFTGKMRLSWYDMPYSRLSPGATWQLTVKLKRPHGKVNPGGFDQAGHLFFQRIRAIGSVRAKKPHQLLQPAPFFNLDNWRYHLAQTIRQTIGDKPSTGIIIALVVGDNSGITNAQQESFRRTGTIHLLVISGLHISAVAALTFFIFLKFWSFLGRAPLWVPAPYFAAVMSLVIAFSYALLAGFSIPTQRALLMITVVVITSLIGGIAVSRKLAFALLGVLIYDPLAVMSSGFWLSFGAITIIIYVIAGQTLRLPQRLRRYYDLQYQRLKRGEKHHFWFETRIKTEFYAWRTVTGIRGFFRTQLAIIAGLTPILVLYGNQVLPLSFLIANVVAIPLFTLVIVPCSLLGTLLVFLIPPVGRWILQFTAEMLAGETFFLIKPLDFIDYLGKLEWGWQPILPPLWTVIAAVVGSMILLLPKGFPIVTRLIGIIWWLPLCFPTLSLPLHNEVELTLLDVGQGLAAVIRTQNHVLLYDTGPSTSREYKEYESWNAGNVIVIPFLRSQGIKHIDRLVISHANSDHSGGAKSIVETLRVKTILTSEPHKIRKMFDTKLSIPPINTCYAGQHWQWDGVDFQILHPSQNYTGDTNNLSCVLKVSSGNNALLLSGDISGKMEYYLTHRYQQELQAEVLIAPHHGSHYSSSKEFIAAVKPQIVLFSAGYLNPFKHPRPEVMQRYQAQGATLLDTIQAGAITVRFSMNGIHSPILAREQRRRYWQN